MDLLCENTHEPGCAKSALKTCIFKENLAFGKKSRQSMRLLHSSIDDASHCAFAAFAYLQSQANAATLWLRLEWMIKMAMVQTQSAIKNAPAFKFASMIENVKTRYARHRIYRQTVNELSALSNRDLADLGLHRSMIHRLAKQAAEDYRPL